MDLDLQPHHSQECNAQNVLDLVGGPFAVIESDPGVFTSLTRKLGVKNIELVEMYDIEPWAVDHLNPRDFEDPAAERVWFANQLSDDACASHAILNVLLNCPAVDIGDSLRVFKQETERMSPVMKGLAITNSPLLRQAHNSLARPADLRGALNSVAISTLDDAKSKAKAKSKPKASPKRGTKPPPAKRAKTSTSNSPNKKTNEKSKQLDEEDEEEAYHFVGYVPAYGKVWELDGLKSGPLEVGELTPPAKPFASPEGSNFPSSFNTDWMDVVRPALRMKMEKYGGSAEGGSNIRFSLLAIVDGLYEKASDELELLKRERAALERRLESGWEKKVDAALLQSAQHILDADGSISPGTGTTYATDFGAQRMDKDIEIANMPERNIIPAWETCIQKTLRAKITVEDEVTKAIRANTDHVKRTFDYEPFFKEFVTKLHNEGLLKPLLNLDEDGKKIKPGGGPGKKTASISGKGKE